jgi:hypothetical protein
MHADGDTAGIEGVRRRMFASWTFHNDKEGCAAFAVMRAQSDG